jgi:hypothetical protein
VPDTGVATESTASASDPQLAARAALGELAAIWFEFPGTSGRGAAVMFSERTTLSPPFYADFAAAVRASPWLRPLTASSFVKTIAQPGRAVLSPRSYRGLGGQYVRRLLAVRSELGQFAQVARGSRTLVDRLRDDLWLSEGATSVQDPALGRRFVESVQARIDRTYDRVRITNTLFTLYSQTGSIPLTISNSSDYEIRARIELLADSRLTFADGDSRPILLPRASRVFTFRVRAKTTGRFPVKVQLKTSDAPAAETITETEIVVRSTAYNRVALFLTIGAALFLFAWWGRRFLPRRNS